jgi:hypothetical protein
MRQQHAKNARILPQENNILLSQSGLQRRQRDQEKPDFFEKAW